MKETVLTKLAWSYFVDVPAADRQSGSDLQTSRSKTMNRCIIFHVFIFLGVFVVDVTCKKDKPDDHHQSLSHHHGTSIYSLIGLLVAFKMKAVLVVLAMWGGIVLTAKLLVALLWPLLSSYGSKCPIKIHGHHEYEPTYFAKNDDDGYYKRWTRRRPPDNDSFETR